MEELFTIEVSVRGEIRQVFINKSHRIEIGDPHSGPGANQYQQHPNLFKFDRAQAAALAEVVRRNFNVADVTVRSA